MFRRRAPSADEAKNFIESVHRRLLNGKHDPITRYRPSPLHGNVAHGDLDGFPQRDKHKKMQVLCLGHSRTGTLSLMAALQQLGYTPYHMTVAMHEPERDLPMWMKGMKAKFEGLGRRWGRKEFEGVLGGYDAVLDIPCIYFAEELLELYPDAKVIVTERDVDAWLTSISRTVGHVLRYRLWPLIAPFDPALTHPWYTFMRYTDVHLSHWTDACEPLGATKARDAYLTHYANLAQIVPAERLLHFKCGDGWEKLCGFLEVEAPKGLEYPKLNDGEFYVAFHDAMWWRAMKMAVRAVGYLVLVAVTAVVLLLWCLRYRGARSEAGD